MPQVLDGKAVAAAIRAEVAADAAYVRQKTGAAPRLAAVLVGDDPASHVYVRSKVRACEESGIESETHTLPATASENEVLQLLRKLNEAETVDGILLQLPLPKHIDKIRALDSIHPSKDVDGLHPTNAGLLVQGRAKLIACTPLGVIEALKRYQVPISGRQAVVVGRSDLVGKPVATLLLHENATVTVCHSKTRDLAGVVSRGDIVVAALGRAGFLTADFIREGAVVMDVGTTVLKKENEIVALFGRDSKKVLDFRAGKTVLAGDVHPEAYEKASLYTPVPGGVGPLTIAMLLRNTVVAARERRFS